MAASIIIPYKTFFQILSLQNKGAPLHTRDSYTH